MSYTLSCYFVDFNIYLQYQRTVFLIYIRVMLRVAAFKPEIYNRQVKLGNFSRSRVMLRESSDAGYFARNRPKDFDEYSAKLQKRVVSRSRWDGIVVGGRRTGGTKRRVVKITSISIYKRYHQSTSLRNKRRNESRCEYVRLFTAHVSRWSLFSPERGPLVLHSCLSFA